jgi:charged multivesicular body protein 3
VKQLATKGDVKSARILAREVVRSHKQQDRLSVSKARLGSINNQLMQQMGTRDLTFNWLPLCLYMFKPWRK